jgi:hypothetical protein
MKNNTDFSNVFLPEIQDKKILNFEYHPCCEVNDAGDVEQCEPEKAQFWSVYIHYEQAGLDCITDHKTEREARDFCAFLSKLLRTQQTPTKILLEVRGGIVQTVNTNSKNAEYVVIDYDNDSEDPEWISSTQAQDIGMMPEDNFYEQMFREDNDSDKRVRQALKQLNF